MEKLIAAELCDEKSDNKKEDALQMDFKDMCSKQKQVDIVWKLFSLNRDFYLFKLIWI